MKTINVSSGPSNQVDIITGNGPQTATVGSAAYGGVYPDVPLPVLTTGQTRWNIGGEEFRRVLYLNGVRQNIGQDYVIDLPYIDWIGGDVLEPDDQLTLASS